MRFTKQVVETLTPPPGKPYGLFWDDAVKGFGVKVSAGGSRQYVAQYRTPDGRTPRITIGRVDTLSVEDARKHARLIFAKAQTGVDPHAERTAARKQASVTLGSVAERYLAHAKDRLKPRSYQEVERHLQKDWQPLAATPLASIKRVDVARHLSAISRTKDATGNEKSRTVAATRARAALSAMFAWAIGEGLAETNPVMGTNKPAEERSRDRVLSEAELRAVWNAAGNDDHGIIVRLLILTAQRRDEVGAMADAELAIDTALWTIPGGTVADGRTTKNKRSHEVPLSPLSLGLITGNERLADRAFVFGRGVKGFSGWSACKKRLDDRIAASGFVMTAPWRLHDLRRTSATMMAERLKVQPHIITALLNHMTGYRSGPTGIYNRATYRDEKREALNRWSEYVLSLV